GLGQERHLPHETWHIVQQLQCRLVPNTYTNCVIINCNEYLECEADRMGALAARLGDRDVSGETAPSPGVSRETSNPQGTAGPDQARRARGNSHPDTHFEPTVPAIQRNLMILHFYRNYDVNIIRNSFNFHGFVQGQ